MIEKVIEIVKSLTEDRQVKVLTMFTDLWPRFSVAPASIKHHGSFEGGLMQHTLFVVESARALWEMYWNQTHQLNCTLEELTFCALVHDIGKIGNSYQDFYIHEETPDKLRVPTQVKYTYNPKFSKMDHELLTLFWLNHYGIQMSEKEMAAIYYHAGPYVEAYKKVAESDLLILLHSADNLTAKIRNI